MSLARHPLVLAVAIGAAARLAAVWLTADLRATEYEYGYIATHLLRGEGYSWDWGGMPLQPTSLFPPLYVFWVAAFRFKFGTSDWVLASVQGLVAATGCVPAWLVGRRVWSARAGTAFAFLYALYPELVFAPSQLVPESLYILGSLWLVVLWFRVIDEDAAKARLKIAAGAGLLGGALLLARESAAIVLSAAIVAWLWRARRERDPGLARATAVCVTVVAVTLTPWIVRNWRVQGEFIPLRSGYGYNLWLGNLPNATGTNWTRERTFVVDALPPEYRASLDARAPMDEQDRDRFYRDEALRLIREDPGRYARLTAQRLRYFLWFDPTYPLANHPVYRLAYIALLATALPGLALAIRHRRVPALCVLTWLGTVALYVPVMVMPRYRLLSNTFLLLFSAILLARGAPAREAARRERA